MAHRISRKWTKAEDEELRKVVSIIGTKNWVKAAVHLSNRSPTQCLQRWYQVLQPGLVKGSWSKEEDEILIAVVKKELGDNYYLKPIPRLRSWKFAEDMLVGRTSKQCRERWTLALDPNINKEEWCKWEDEKIIQLQALLGNKWCLIRELLNNNRTENAVKLRFKKLDKAKRKRKSEGIYYQPTKKVTTCESLVTLDDFAELSHLLRN
eukprot:snap_masked-scaffold_9-processed-gene-0.6-mRNA-1 protein AED:0.43 eAED:0.47 QI:0/-1/0/1/-1/1/1/0/207